jgi:predicted DNA-binding transcriptional regulator AlpA
MVSIHLIVLIESVCHNEAVGGYVNSLLTEQDVAKQLHVSLAALRRWRLEGRGPRFIKVGSLVRYRPEELEQWVAAQPTGGSSAARQPAAGLERAARSARLGA